MALGQETCEVSGIGTGLAQGPRTLAHTSTTQLIPFKRETLTAGRNKLFAQNDPRNVAMNPVNFALRTSDHYADASGGRCRRSPERTNREFISFPMLVVAAGWWRLPVSRPASSKSAGCQHRR